MRWEKRFTLVYSKHYCEMVASHKEKCRQHPWVLRTDTFAYMTRFSVIQQNDFKSLSRLCCEKAAMEIFRPKRREWHLSRQCCWNVNCFRYVSVYRLILFADSRWFSMVPIIIVWASEQLALDKFVMSVCRLTCSLCFDVDPCSFHVCKSYQDCVVVDNKAKCQCPRCASKDDRVCADNGKSYPSECYMRAKACKIKRELNVVKKGECGTVFKYVYSI